MLLEFLLVVAIFFPVHYGLRAVVRCEEHVPSEVVSLADLKNALDDQVGKISQEQGAKLLGSIVKCDLHAETRIVALAGVIVLEWGVDECAEFVGHVLLVDQGEFVTGYGQAVFREILEILPLPADRNSRRHERGCRRPDRPPISIVFLTRRSRLFLERPPRRRRGPCCIQAEDPRCKPQFPNINFIEQFYRSRGSGPDLGCVRAKTAAR